MNITHFYLQLTKRQRISLFFVVLLIISLPITIYQVFQQQTLEQEAASNKPNFIVVMTDDQRFDQMETLPTVRKELADKGLTFTNAYISTPICCPSRAAFFTGRYAHNTDMWHNSPPHGGFKTFKKSEDQTLAVWLDKAGYKTALIGKYLNKYDNAKHVPKGWSKWFAYVDGQTYYDYTISDNGKLKKFGKKRGDYSVDVFAKEAVKFIKDTKKPFLLVLTPNAPHAANGEDSGSRLSGAVSAPRHEKNCKVDGWKEPPSFNEKDVSDKPKWVKNIKKKVSYKDANRFYKSQLCSLKSVDDAVSDMLKALGPRAKNTVFIFYSDNGYSIGEHGYTKKNCFYEECARVPFIISYPKMISQKIEIDQPVVQVDIPATIADLAGAKVPVKIQGKSLAPLFKNPDAKIRDAILMEVNQSRNRTGTAIRQGDYKYIELKTKEYELYDLKKDPYELNNLIDDKEYTEIVKELSKNLTLLRKDKEPKPLISPTPEPSIITPSPSDDPSLTPSPTRKATATPVPDEDEEDNQDEDIDEDEQIDEDEEDFFPDDNENKPEKGIPELILSITLNGIGSGGDSIQPNESNFSNKEPATPYRIFSTEIIDSSKGLITTALGYLEYNVESGKYEGSIVPEDTIPEGDYTIKIQTPVYLSKSTSRAIHLTPGDTTNIPDLQLVTGDVNGDDQLSILDYNMLIECYGDGDLTDTCYNESHVIGDLNDDAYVLGEDYNLFLREFSAQKIQ